jgi:hypothetical protein
MNDRYSAKLKIAMDFEWWTAPGKLPEPFLLTAAASDGRQWVLRGPDLYRLRQPPFPTGHNVVVTSYSLASDLVNFPVLGWRMPDHLVCTYIEHRLRYNGIESELDDTLVGACARRNIVHLMSDVKKRLQERAKDRTPLIEAEWREYERYCLEDSRADLKLFQSYLPDIWWERALYYGAFARDCAIIEYNGYPMNPAKVRLLRPRTLKEGRLRLIEELDGGTRVYEKGSLKNSRIWELAREHNIPWRATNYGRPVLKDAELKSLAVQYPIVEKVRQIRKTVNSLRSNEYDVDSDGYSHVSLFPCATKTGRCAAKGKHWIWAGPAWMRGAVQPTEGSFLAYLDYESEEFAFAAVQSGDEGMMACYLSGDPYAAVGIAMGIMPAGATKLTHPTLRERCKVICLGINYGMQAWGLAERLGISEEVAGDLLRRHRQAFPKYWRWIEGMIAHAKAHKMIVTPFGWPMYVQRGINPRTLQNWPQQALGGDLLRLATMGLVHEGVRIATLVHDAILIEGASRDVAGLVKHAKDVMARASEKICGMPLRVDSGDDKKPQVFCYPARFRDKREGDMYDRAMRVLSEVESTSFEGGMGVPLPHY